MKYSQRWRQTTIANRLLVISSVLLTFVSAGLVVVGVLQYRTSKNQLGVMQGMIDQNERLIKASSDQASASAKSASVAEGEKQAVLDSAQAAKDSASAANTATEQNKKLISAARVQADAARVQAEAARIQANASQVSAKAAEESTKISAQALSVGERAYITLRRLDIAKLAIGEPPEITAWFVNAGRTPASNFVFYQKIYLAEIKGRPIPPTGGAGEDLERFIRRPDQPMDNESGFLAAAGEKRVIFTTDWIFTESHLAAINTGSLKLFFEGEVHYIDSFDRRQKFRYCGMYNAKAAEFDECPEQKPN